MDKSLIMLEGKTIKSSSQVDKIQALNLKLDSLKLDLEEFKSELNEKALSFINSEIEKTETDLCFLGINGNMIKFLMFFK